MDNKARDSIEVRVGPSASVLAHAAAETHSPFLVARVPEDNPTEWVFHLPVGDRRWVASLLRGLTRLRNVVILFAGETLSCKEFAERHLCPSAWRGSCDSSSEPRNSWFDAFGCDEIHWKCLRAVRDDPGTSVEVFERAMSDASEFRCGRLHPSAELRNLVWLLAHLDEDPDLIPPTELLELSRHCLAGEWTALIPPAEPDDDQVQSHLDLFCGAAFVKDPIVQRAVELRQLRPHEESRKLRYLIADEMNRPHYHIEGEVEYGLALAHLHRQMKDIHRFSPNVARPLVYVSVGRECCVTCRRLYTDGSTGAPFLFYLDELGMPGSNGGKPLADWLPTLPPLHVSCRCSLRHFHPRLFRHVSQVDVEDLIIL